MGRWGDGEMGRWGKDFDRSSVFCLGTFLVRVFLKLEKVQFRCKIG
ncbi:MAG: hypothetical protein F6K58_26755 [Symploca sp. SIO2E9]|nr:hypothetical protein [Symploca sp. SIO2E9]